MEQQAEAPKSSRILVVDDEKLLRKLTSSILSSQGYHVDTCSNGNEALQLYQVQRYDLVILDMIMPELNGAETFKALMRKDPKARVIIISGYCDHEVSQGLFDLGLAAFLEKPVRRDSLIRNVAGILGSSR